MLVSLLYPLQSHSQSMDNKAIVLQVSGAIGPATSDYISGGLAIAAKQDATLLVIQLDTPGGLDLAMRDIIRNIIASPVPVVMYVYPSGSRAASAGTYMLYASHVAAMAPATNLGAATPVQIGGMPGPGNPVQEPSDGKEEEPPADERAGMPDDPMTSKMVNDAVAYIRGLADLRGRNADWAEQAVREASSISSSEALEMNVVDVIAVDMTELFAKINGKTVSVNGSDLVIDTQGIQMEMVLPDWRNKLLSVITNPNIAYILMLLGIYGLFFELANPGFVLPGVIGAICLLLALYSMQILPVNYAGLGLIILGIAFMTAEAFMPSFGVLGLGGVIAFIIGSVILFDKDGGGLAISVPVIVSVSVVSTGFFLIIVRSTVRSFRSPVVSGREQLIGSTGVAQEDFEGDGFILVHGERWQAECGQPLHKGDSAIITGVRGLKLQVTPEREDSK